MCADSSVEETAAGAEASEAGKGPPLFAILS